MTLDMKLAMIAVFIQVAMTFYAIFATGRARLASIADDKIKLRELAVKSTAYSVSAQQQANNLSNQFEFPVLLYVAVAFAAIFDASSLAFGIACLGFVITRILHRIEHVTRNNVRHRFTVYVLGILLLAIAWVLLGLEFFGVI